MEITVNQQIYHVPDHCNVQMLLSSILQLPAGGFAVAIGENIIPGIQWEQQRLSPGDQVIIIKAAQGG